MSLLTHTATTCLFPTLLGAITTSGRRRRTTTGPWTCLRSAFLAWSAAVLLVACTNLGFPYSGRRGDGPFGTLRAPKRLAVSHVVWDWESEGRKGRGWGVGEGGREGRGTKPAISRIWLHPTRHPSPPYYASTFYFFPRE